MLDRSKMVRVVKALTVLMLLGGAAKFYHYNYVEHIRGQARTLRLPGLRELVCKGQAYTAGQVDQCGKRSIFRDPDWGITAYFTIYGVESREEAEAIAKFMVEARNQSGQEHIPMNVQVYSTPRSEGPSRPSQYKIFDKDL